MCNFIMVQKEMVFHIFFHAVGQQELRTSLKPVKHIANSSKQPIDNHGLDSERNHNDSDGKKSLDQWFVDEEEMVLTGMDAGLDAGRHNKENVPEEGNKKKGT